MSKKSCEAAESIEDALLRMARRTVRKAVECSNGAENCSQSCGMLEWRGELFAKLWNARMAR